MNAESFGTRRHPHISTVRTGHDVGALASLSTRCALKQQSIAYLAKSLATFRD